jgi:FKBP-type peptidyl-prolyl cis-trans isomerase
MHRPIALAALAAALAACGAPDEPAPAPDAPAPPAGDGGFAPALGVDTAESTRTASGLLIRDLEVGTGEEAAAGRRVAVLYTGWLTDGTRFDGNMPNGPTLPFTIGAGEVIPGWDEGVAGMRVGGRRQLVIPPELAYGPFGSGPIPPDATLVFEVELIGVQ